MVALQPFEARALPLSAAAAAVGFIGAPWRPRPKPRARPRLYRKPRRRQRPEGEEDTDLAQGAAEPLTAGVRARDAEQARAELGHPSAGVSGGVLVAGAAGVRLSLIHISEPPRPY